MICEIRVEQVDIDGATRSHSCRCPVARAIKRQVPGVNYVSYIPKHFGSARVVFANLDNFNVKIPDEVNERAARYDETGEMKPFVFTLELKA